AVVHVLDASKAVTVVGNLLQQETSTSYKKEIKEDYEKLRVGFFARNEKKEMLSIEEARNNRLQIDWEKEKIGIPKILGTKQFDEVDLKRVVPYIDWTPFFRTWELHGKYPAILEDKEVGNEASQLFKDAKKMLKEVIDKKLLTAKAIFGLFPVNAVGDDIEVYSDADRNEVRTRFVTLRQQSKKKEGIPNLALADFIAPKDSGKEDYMGAFCVTAGFGTDELSQKYLADHDDYHSIMIKAIADRLAEALAEYVHMEVRRQYWGYAPEETLSNEELIKEKYIGIRPAPGYPACPDHTEKLTIWDLLEVEDKIGVKLTESLAMWPAASVSGYYFANERSRYFGLGKITEDQVKDFAERKGMRLEEAKKWLSPNLMN
ncbi:MAG: vitamin B12 dependent-methionine synthase activation domain-containing protein, partial [Lutimonas sp.]